MKTLSFSNVNRMAVVSMAFLLMLLAASARSQSLSICDVPTKLPRDMRFGTYSPPLCFEYDGLQAGETYTLKVWLLTPSSWACASSQWCERHFILDDTSHTNGAGRLLLVETWDVHDYSRFDWVLRLYNSSGVEVAFTERFTDATENRPPILTAIGDQNLVVGQPTRIVVTASDPNGDAVSLSATNLPDGASFDSTLGLFDWVPASEGTFAALFLATDTGDGPLQDAELVTFDVKPRPVIVSQPANQAVAPGTAVDFEVNATSDTPMRYQWHFNGQAIPGATSPNWSIAQATMADAGVYTVEVRNESGSAFSHEALLTVYTNRPAIDSLHANLDYLRSVMDEYHYRFPVYDDISSGGNHFHARGQIPDETAAVGINGSWTNDPHSGATCTRFTFTNTTGLNYGGFYFLNGILVGTKPVPYFGESFVPGTKIPVTESTGLDLTGAAELTFWARGEQGGESIEFFVGGVGRGPATGVPLLPFYDSTPRWPRRGTLTQLTTEWQQYSIDVSELNLTNLMGALGWVANAPNNPLGAVFYLDDIQFELTPERQEERLNEPRFLRSYTTRPRQSDVNDANKDDDFDFVLRNVAYLYDNSLVVLAFLADGSPDSVRRARLIGDAMIYGLEHDRAYSDGRLRTAYSSGDIALPPGWEVNGLKATVTMPGFYLEPPPQFYEVENQNVDTGNNAWAMIALLALHKETGEANYLEAAERVGQFIQTQKKLTGKYPGYLGGIQDAELPTARQRTYSSTEHNLDIVAAFAEMFRLTGEPQWQEGSQLASDFVEAMWKEEWEAYLTGTRAEAPDERNDNEGQLPLDTQSWNVLVRPEVLDLHPQLFASTQRHHGLTADGFTGFDFNEDRDGVWFEGTAQMATAYALAGRIREADQFLAQLSVAQQMPWPVGDGTGIVAASRDAITTGFGFNLFRRPHIGATAWAIYAQAGYNPYYQTRIPVIRNVRRTEGRVEFEFLAAAQTAYRVEFATELNGVNWQTLIAFPPSPETALREVSDVIPLVSSNRFYRLLIP